MDSTQTQIADLAEAYSAGDPMALTEICQGTAVTAAIRRSGGEDLRLSETGGLLASLPQALASMPAFRSFVASSKIGAAAYLQLEAQSGEPFFDQQFALSLIRQYLVSGLPLPLGAAPGRAAVPVVQGLAGSGKTYTLAQTVKMALELGLKPIVIAPTNAAVKVLRKALLSAGIEKSAAEISTAHKALRRQALTQLGEAAFVALERWDRQLPGEAICVEGVPLDEAAFANMYFARAKQAALRRAHDYTVQCRKDNGELKPFAVLRCLQKVGFRALDPALMWWSETGVTEDSLVLGDEAGMLPHGMLLTVLNAGAKFIAFGDPLQLPPVGTLYYHRADGTKVPDSPMLRNILPHYTVHLQRSRRTQNGSVIPALAAQCFITSAVGMRQAIGAAAKEAPDQVRIFQSLSEVPKDDLLNGVTIAWRNRARFAANRVTRQLLGMPTDSLGAGEWLSVDTADDEGEFTKDERLRVQGVVLGEDNVLRAVLERDEGEDGIDLLTTEMRFRDERLNTEGEAAGLYMKGLGFEYCGGEFWGAEIPSMTFSYCVTSHKSQGGGWPSVTILLGDILCAGMQDDTPLPDGRVLPTWCRLLYTAITRTRGHINIVA
jgi:hypothetical protein